MPDPYSGAYFGIDEDPMNRPGGQTAAGAFSQAYPERSGTQPTPWSRPTPTSTGGGFIDERNRTFWDILLGRPGRERYGPNEAYGPPAAGGAATGMPTELHAPGGAATGMPTELHAPGGASLPPAKPVTKITSNQALADAIRALINPPQPAGAPTLGMPSSWEGTNAMNLQAPPARQLPGYEHPAYMTMPYSEADLRRPMPSAGERMSMHATPGGNRYGGNKFGGNLFGGNKFGGNLFGGNLFGPGATPQGRAGGGFMGEEPEVPDMPQYRPAPAPPPPQAPPPMAPPPMPAEQGGGGMGDILKLGMSVLPFLLAEGGPVAQRGGYPELYDKPIRQGYFSTGGASNYVGSDSRGDGRSDHIDAKLSPGEYVVDADTNALLGDGDPAAGARKLDQMRENIRRHKGPALAKGKIAPPAKRHAEEYLSKGLSRSALKNVGR